MRTVTCLFFLVCYMSPSTRHCLSALLSTRFMARNDGHRPWLFAPVIVIRGRLFVKVQGKKKRRKQEKSLALLLQRSWSCVLLFSPSMPTDAGWFTVVVWSYCFLWNIQLLSGTITQLRVLAPVLSFSPLWEPLWGLPVSGPPAQESHAGGPESPPCCARIQPDWMRRQ